MPLLDPDRLFPVDPKLRDQARAKAEAVVKRASAHMALEKQSLSSEQTRAEIGRLAEQLLRDTDHQENIQDREALKLWMWHALEENEHKSVAYDVYELIGGGYFTRIFAMIVATIGFIVFVGQGHLRMLWANGTLFDIKDNAKGFWKLLGWKGLFPRLFFKYMDFYRPGFHPNDHDTVKLLEDWRERMLNEGGLLAEQTYSKSKAA